MKTFVSAIFLVVGLPVAAIAHEPTASADASAQGGSATASPAVNTTNSTEIYYPQTVPNIVGPVPRGSVPVLSVYGQMDYQQRGTYGAQISIPLAR